MILLGKRSVLLLSASQTFFLLQVTKSVLPLKESNNGQLPARQTSAETDLPDTSTPLKDNHALPPVQESPIPSSLKRSASDVNLGRRPSQTNS